MPFAGYAPWLAIHTTHLHVVSAGARWKNPALTTIMADARARVLTRRRPRGQNRHRLADPPPTQSGTRRSTDRRRSTVGCRRRDAGLELHLLQAFAQPLHDFPRWTLAQVAEHMLRRGRRWMVQENVSAYRVRVACRVGHHTVARNRGERDLGSTCARVMAGDVQAYLTLPPQSACPNARGRTMRPPGLYVTPILAGIDAI